MAASSADSTTGGEASIGGAVRHAPAGYLICNGDTIPSSGVVQNINASLLQNLRIFLDNTYGAYGRLPNLVDRFAGYSAVPGASGGETSVTLTVDQIPIHNHGITDPGHSHNISNCNSVDGRAFKAEPENFYRTNSGNKGTDPALTGITGTNNTGGGGAHNNIPPYVGMLPVIKY
jgi:microcystin-dependent protein